MLLLLLSSSRAVWVVLQPCGLTHVPQWLFQVPSLPGAVGWQSQSCSLLCNCLRPRGALLSQGPRILGTLGPVNFKGCICHPLPCSTAVLSSFNPQHRNGPAIACTCMARHRGNASAISSSQCLLQMITKTSIEKSNSQKVLCYIAMYACCVLRECSVAPYRPEPAPGQMSIVVAFPGWLWRSFCTPRQGDPGTPQGSRRAQGRSWWWAATRCCSSYGNGEQQVCCKEVALG